VLLASSYFFNGPCGNHIGTKFLEVVCDEHGVGGSGEYCGDYDAHFGRINVFYDEALCGKYVPCAVLFDLKPGVINAVALSCRSASCSARKTS
jgi:tubulin beta